MKLSSKENRPTNLETMGIYTILRERKIIIEWIQRFPNHSATPAMREYLNRS